MKTKVTKNNRIALLTAFCQEQCKPIIVQKVEKAERAIELHFSKKVPTQVQETAKLFPDYFCFVDQYYKSYFSTAYFSTACECDNDEKIAYIYHIVESCHTTRSLIFSPFPHTQKYLDSNEVDSIPEMQDLTVTESEIIRVLIDLDRLLSGIKFMEELETSCPILWKYASTIIKNNTINKTTAMSVDFETLNACITKFIQRNRS